MTKAIEDARLEGERRIGRRLSEDEFQELLRYASRKAECQGNGPDYVPLLLPDVIRENELSKQSIELYRARRELEAELMRQNEKEAEKWKQLSDLSRLLGVSITEIVSALSAAGVSLPMSCAMS